MTSLADALRAFIPVLEALASEAEARGQGGDPLLNDRQVAADLGVHPSQVCRLRRSGLLPSVSVGSRARRVPRSALERYKQAQLRRSA